MSVILQCTCTHEFQDATYGKGMRVFNETGKDQQAGYRCTVCGNTITRDKSSKKK